jgi:LEA14-like dessication related protein
MWVELFLVVISGSLLESCTPLGLWMYEDPVVSVARITYELHRSAPVESPLVVDLAVKNANDYPVSAEHVELSLHLDGLPIGQIKRDSTVSVANGTVSTLAVPVTFNSQTARRREDVVRSGTHSFAVKGKATFRTPIGTRTVRFAQEGSLIFGVRPGQSSM